MSRVLYIVNGSISSMRALLALHEKGLAFEARRMRVMRAPRDTQAPAFLALNPRGQCPVLVEPDGTTLNESLAILSYLELRYPSPALLPAAAEPQALARCLAFAQETETTGMIYEPIEQLFKTPPAQLSSDARAAIIDAVAGLERELALWEGRAAQHAFIAGDRVSLADCAFYPVLTYLLRRGLTLGARADRQRTSGPGSGQGKEPTPIEIPTGATVPAAGAHASRFPALAAYHARFAARASAIAAHPEGWEQGRVGRPDLFALAASLA